MRLLDYFNYSKQSSKTDIGYIGVEFAKEHIHLVQLATRGEHVTEFYQLCSIDYMHSRDDCLGDKKYLKDCLDQAFNQYKFKGRKAVVSVPADKVKIVTVSYLLKDNVSEERLILESLQNRIGEDLTSYVIDYVKVRVEDKEIKRGAVVCLAKREFINQFLDVLTGAGLNVQYLEVSPIAIRRLINVVPKQNYRENDLIINFGAQGSFITLLSGRRMLSDQPINCCENRLVDQIAMVLKIPQDKTRTILEHYGFGGIDDFRNLSQFSLSAGEISKTLKDIARQYLAGLIDDINRMLVYAASETHGEKVSQIFILGGMARWPGMDKLIEQMINIKVDVVDPLGSFDNKLSQQRPIAEKGIEYAVATGLALRGLRQFSNKALQEQAQ